MIGLSSQYSRLRTTVETKDAQKRSNVNRTTNLRRVFSSDSFFVVVFFFFSFLFFFSSSSSFFPPRPKCPEAVASHQKTRRTLVSSWATSWLSASSSATFYSAVKFSCAFSSGGLALASKSARGTSGLCARVSPCGFRVGVYVELSFLLARVSTICHLGT